MPKTYREAGVDIKAGDEAVKRIKKLARKTFKTEVVSDIGLFGGMFSAKFTDYKNPVLVSSVDGVGTKLKIAFMMNKHNTIGRDLVNHCVNDILVCGAKPLFFLDYIAMGKMEPETVEEIVSGIVEACVENDCSLIGGETAEMPGFYKPGEYDVAGTIVGVVEKEKIINGSKIKPNDVLIGLPSNGLHTNGYSLARAVLFEHYKIDDYIPELGTTLGEELLKIHKSYLKPVLKIIENFEINGMAHITGGGIVGNVSRIIPEGLTLKIDWKSWERPPVFDLIQKLGSIAEDEMRKTFNLGVGLVLIVDKDLVDRVIYGLKLEGEKPFVMGEVYRCS